MAGTEGWSASVCVCVYTTQIYDMALEAAEFKLAASLKDRICGG